MNTRALVPIISFVAAFAFLPLYAAFAEDATTTPETPAPAPETATITIRSGDITPFTGAVELSSTTSPVDIIPTNGTSPIAVPARSLLAVLTALDATTSDFDITDLGYFSSFDSFIINCIAIPTISPIPCFNWTYAINGLFPQTGIDDALLADGDIVHLFFGPPRQTTLATSTVFLGESFTARAEHYDLDTGEYLPSPGLTLAVGTANPDFSFTELASATSDEQGQAIFTLSATGTYSVGIAEDFYFPSASITILELAITSEDSSESPPPTPSGGGGERVHIQLDVGRALSFLSGKQLADGSFGDSLYTDWAAIAFAAADPGAAKGKLREYLLAAAPSLSNITDYERHAMALMALGIDPYSGTSKDYIAPIVNAFDGTQIGDPIVHDDIFAFFPLLKAGYGPGDDIIQKTAAFIVSKQQANGSWGDPDTTGAALQALTQVPALPDVSSTISKAKGYLHSAQQSNGGWSNGFSTSWVMQGIAALGETPAQWSAGGLYPEEHLASLQASDGGVEPVTENDATRVWATSFAIPAALEMMWPELLQSFPRPVASGGGGQSGGGTIVQIATSTAISESAAGTTTPAEQTIVSEDTELERSEQPVKKPALSRQVAITAEAAELGTDDTVQAESLAEIIDTAPESQLAAAGASGWDVSYLVLPALLLLAALAGAFGYPVFLKVFRRIFP